MKTALGLLLAFSLPALAQAPSTETFVLSLKTMSKALSGCRQTYTRSPDASKQPLLKSVIGADNYEKDLTSLGLAEKFTNFLISHPEQISGRALVAILSSSDDFSVGVGSTRAAILARFIDPTARISSADATSFAFAASALDSCQKNIFNAGDDYVDLVMKFVGAEDEALANKSKKRPT